MINKEFIRKTDKLIQKIQDRQIVLANNNILLSKVTMDEVTTGGIILANTFKEIEEFKRGFGRILALPKNLIGDENLNLKVGDYVIYVHHMPYLPYREVLEEVLGESLEDKSIYTISDNEILLIVSADILHS